MLWTVLHTPELMQILMVWTLCFLVGILCGKL